MGRVGGKAERRLAPRVIVGAVAAFVVAWLVYFSVDTEYDSSKQLSSHLRLVEHKRNRRSAFTGAGRYMPVIYLPVPSSETITLWQTLLRDDQPVWHSMNGYHAGIAMTMRSATAQ